MREVFKTITDYPHYEVSNLGRVFSNRVQNKRKELKQNQTGGYPTVRLTGVNGASTKYVHQLMAIEFLGHTVNGHKLVVNHINHIRTDNRVENLEIVTNRTNTNKVHLCSTSKFPGVYWNEASSKWSSSIWDSSIDKRVSLGLFEEEFDAALAYIKALDKLDR